MSKPELLYSKTKTLLYSLHVHSLLRADETKSMTLALTKVRDSGNSFEYKEPSIISVMIQGIKYLYHRVLDRSLEIKNYTKTH